MKYTKEQIEKALGIADVMEAPSLLTLAAAYRDAISELEQERQDRKQAEIDITRALGERNDARAETMMIKAALDKALAENLAMRKPACNPPQA